MQIALSRPAARESWHAAMIQAERDGRRQWRLRLAEARKVEAERINSSLLHRAPPGLASDWQPPSPSRCVVGGWGRGDHDGPSIDTSERDAQRAQEERAQAEAKLKVDMEAAKQAEDEWWGWYLKSKEETQQEATRRAAEEARAEEERLAKKEAARQAKMEQMRKEEMQRRAKAKAEAERVERANAEQRKQVLAAEEEERKRKAEEVRAARRAKQGST